MKIIRSDASEALSEALKALHAGQTVIHATETCYGIACDLTNPQAVERLFVTKQRPLDQPVSALFSSIEEAQKFVVFSKRALEIAEKYLPGPLTLVLPTREDAPYPIHVCPPTSTISSTIGVRISPHPFALALTKAFGKPIATTSANLHGKPNPYSVSDIEAQWEQSSPLPDVVIDVGILPTAPPSTVIMINGDELTVLRSGVISLL